MDRSEKKGPAPDRRLSTRRSIAVAAGAADDDDDYDLDAMAVSDGFRPTDHSDPRLWQSSSSLDPSASSATSSSTSQPSASPQLSLSTPDTTPKQSSDVSRRPSSISKVHRPHDSLTLRNDGTGTAAKGLPTRSIVANGGSSGAPIVRAESPYQGPSGPSHPYDMYPQRTLSTATASTNAPSVAAVASSSQPYVGPNGPTHPYALYTQNTTPVEEENSEPHIPVGFNNMGGGYQRQIGPDGEDAGALIGPLGHTEELPPYSRYPTEAYARKNEPDQPTTTAAAAVSPVSTVAAVPAATPAPMPMISGAGGIGIATRNPEFSSTREDLALPGSRQSMRSTVSVESHHEINTAAQEIAEKPRTTKWQRRAKKKLWGIIPYWAICLLVAGLVIMGAVMGAVIGTVLSNDDTGSGSQSKDPDHRPPPFPTVDPVILSSVPSELVPLATGSFALPELDSSLQSRSCFNDSTQSQAWNCEIPGRIFIMDVRQIPNASETQNFELSLRPFDPRNSKYIWGTLPPNVPDPVLLTLVNDTFEPGRNAAWWLKVTYNKTVIVPEDGFNTNSNSKRGEFSYIGAPPEGFDPSQFKKKSRTAVDGDKPWICTWPQTTLEIFIFPSQNSSLAVTSTTSSPESPTQTSGSTPSSSPTSGFENALGAYPRMIKFRERRLGDDQTRPMCRQVEIYNDGHNDRPALDQNRQPIVAEIQENDWRRAFDDRRDRDPRDLNALFRRSPPELTDCGCLWWSV